MDNKPKISRRKFLQTCGSVIAGASILGVTGVLLQKRFGQKGQEVPINCLDCSVCKVDCPLRKGVTI